MRFREFVIEGGWDTTLTQGTVLKPKAVKSALEIIDRFVEDFNKYLEKEGLGPIKRGKPTGSSAYYQQDQEENPDKVYGDIDLQMVAPPIEGKTQTQMGSIMNKLVDDFTKAGKAPYFDTTESKPGHPIVQIGDNDYVQVDLMWHEESLANWGAARVTPERGVKGLLHGNMFSVLGQLLNMSIQHAGVQLKTIDGEQVPFNKQKSTELVTVSIDPETFILDTFEYVAKRQKIDDPDIDSLLKKYPGNKTDDVKIENLVNSIKGFAKSAEKNDMFGKGALTNYSSSKDFLDKFLSQYIDKAMADVNSKKRDKATTPQAKARAKQDQENVLKGIEMVKDLF